MKLARQSQSSWLHPDGYCCPLSLGALTGALRRRLASSSDLVRLHVCKAWRGELVQAGKAETFSQGSPPPRSSVRSVFPSVLCYLKHGKKKCTVNTHLFTQHRSLLLSSLSCLKLLFLVDNKNQMNICWFHPSMKLSHTVLSYRILKLKKLSI